jgi:hypothetical protein
MLSLALKSLVIVAAAGILAAAILILAKWIATAVIFIIIFGAIFLWIRSILKMKRSI